MERAGPRMLEWSALHKIRLLHCGLVFSSTPAPRYPWPDGPKTRPIEKYLGDDVIVNTSAGKPFKTGPRRFHALDGLRTVAVFAVVTYHALPSVLKGGGVGVDIFFTLSGFVITNLILNEYRESAHVRIRSFYLRRVARLWPALGLLCAVVAFAAIAFPSSVWRGEQWNAVLSGLHVMNFARGGWFTDSITGGSMGHAWSLAVEEHFYLVWPLLLIALLKAFTIRRILVLTIVLAALAIILRIFLQVNGAGWERIYNGPDTRADQLLIGCALALAVRLSDGRPNLVEKLTRISAALAWPSIVLLASVCAVIAYPRQDATWEIAYRSIGPSIIAVATATVIAAVVTRPQGLLQGALGHPWLAWPGRHLSYGIYLWHYPILFVLTDMITGANSGPLRFILAIAMTCLVALASSRFVEEPIRRYVHRATSIDNPQGSSAPVVEWEARSGRHSA